VVCSPQEVKGEKAEDGHELDEELWEFELKVPRHLATTAAKSKTQPRPLKEKEMASARAG